MPLSSFSEPRPGQVLMRVLGQPPELQDEFDALVALIMAEGYRGRFWSQTWTYVDLDGWSYWPSMSWYGADRGKANTMLNRRRLDDGQLRFEEAS